ncbi:AIPR family protein [Rhodococcus sp. IEGM 1307]|uniref:AIPR family protein n=1 Tax=Rhodococcus sp. IEGM 1307 TaxID=3047091 RepID=UPI0024B66CBB|nr:AIPR family protein [Rhodococcus sp. IEGM 1307]MDI9979340.1 AIPR family protein [Rhodococcus sp. IEGM 1307]
MDILTKRKMNSFAKENGFEGNESELFEKYVAGVYLGRYLGSDVKLIDDVVIGGGGDGGIDIAAIVVNGSIVTDPSDIIDLIADREDNNVRVVYIQAKTSESFDTKLISKFLHGIEQVTKHAADSSTVPLESGLSQTVAILDAVLENIGQFNAARIPCDIYYVTTSKHNGKDAAADSQVLASMERLRELDFYPESLACQLHGKAELAAKQQERSGPQKVQFNFPKKQSIPEADGIEQAYIGVIQATELLKILSDGQGFRPGIFDDNVRLYQGDDNVVNERIYDTLKSGKKEMFPFLNNGLTIIARELTNVADKFSISGYQVVNGGQTSNQILRWSEYLRMEGGLPGNGQSGLHQSGLQSIWVPIKIISTKSPEILSEVTIATNLQTSIAATDIQSSSQDAKDVEEYFSQSGAEGLRYERQSGLDASRDEFPRLRVVSTPDLNRAVASCVFGESSRAIGSPNEFSAEDSFLWRGHPVAIYYFSAWILYRVERYFARNLDVEKRALKAAKYHVAMLVSAQVLPEVKLLFANPSDSKSMKKVGQAAHDLESWEASVDKAIDLAIDVVGKYFENVLSEGRALRKDDVRALKNQTELLAELENYQFEDRVKDA